MMISISSQVFEINFIPSRLYLVDSDDWYIM